MKTSFINITMAALLLAACGHRTSGSQGSAGDGADADSAMVIGEDLADQDSITITTEHFVKQREDTMAIVGIRIDWPTAGHRPLVNAVRNYICEQLASMPYGDEKPKVTHYTDGQAAADATAERHYKLLFDGKKEALATGYAEGMAFSYLMQIEKLEESDRYVTYLTNQEGYNGGAHGYAMSTGITFRKSDGKRIAYTTEYNPDTESFRIKQQTLFRDTNSPKLYAIIKEGVRSYFSDFESDVNTDQGLLDMLLNVSSVDSIPLPAYPPYFTSKGLCFTYQQYDIAPYSSGMPNFIVPYDKIRPLLTSDAASLIK
ncbi:MAG: DUF3298 domain-containing protein [Prevotella sp.]|nr:DUF3298 domain-containing protein [Prevotella sp.]